MKRKHGATIENVTRGDPGTDWRDVEALLIHLGAEREEGDGSTVTFVLNERKLTVDRPHPSRDSGHGWVKRVRIFLKEYPDHLVANTMLEYGGSTGVAEHVPPAFPSPPRSA